MEQVTIQTVIVTKWDGSHEHKVMLYGQRGGALYVPAFTERGAQLLAEALQNAINAHGDALAILG